MADTCGKPQEGLRCRHIHNIRKNVSKHLPRHTPQASKTLMRHSVRPPGPRGKAPLKATTGRLVKPVRAAVAPKLSAGRVEAQRLAHASAVKKSNAISRFAKSVFAYEPGAMIMPGSAKTSAPTVATPVATPEKLPTTDLLERALSQATSHRQTSKRHHRLGKKVMNLGSAGLAILLLAGFIAYQNAANLTLHHAAGKAGFAAKLPGYRPSGFSLGRFAYSPGYVSINFHSNSDSRAFAVIERPSTWAAQPLAIDAQHNATLVKNGVQYQIQANGSLSDHQLIEIASSL